MDEGHGCSRTDRGADRDRHCLYEPLRLSRSGLGLDGREGNRPRRRSFQGRLRDAHPSEKLSPAGSVMDLRANWNYPTSVRFGAGRINELSDAVQVAGMRNPLFVTDPNLAKLPMAQQAAVSLGNARIFSDIKSN